MPESIEIPGTYWTFPDSYDREALLEQSRNLELWGFAGRAALPDGTWTNFEVFMPRDIDQVDVNDRLDGIVSEAGITCAWLLPINA